VKENSFQVLFLPSAVHVHLDVFALINQGLICSLIGKASPISGLKHHSLEQ